MSPKSLLAVALIIALALLVVPPSASADLGVERASRGGGAPGDVVRLTLGCGSCSLPGQDADAFPVSLVPVAKAPKPRRCGPNALCPPRVRAAPKRAPFAYLGEARRSGGDEGALQRYVLDFAIPQLRPGSYTYAIYCDFCLDGKGGSLITEPNYDPDWRLRVRR